ncbi:MAG: hypothetical protein KIH63_004715 [Candidatus Saccharibacteria bacterium]|nr:hypothetical protein [Candidatus Saccharibacteria bacterium]
MSNYTYEHVIAGGRQLIHRLPDGAWIPADLDNGDYRRYLKDKEEGVLITEVNYDTGVNDVQ